MAIQLHRMTEDGVRFETYELWEFAHWSYWRSRYHIKHIIAFCEAALRRQTGVDYMGYELAQGIIGKLWRNEVLPASVLRGGHHISQPDDYGGEQYFGSKETDEWEAVKEEFGEGNLDSLIEAAEKSRYGRAI